MFDSFTRNLIESAPPLAGLDLSHLADELSAAHAEIAAARLRIQSPIDLPEFLVTLEDLTRGMRRLAETYEGLIVLDISVDDRTAAAFVSAAARQMLLQIETLKETHHKPARLDGDGIGSAIAASLLLLIAQRPADAYDMADFILPVTAEIPQGVIGLLLSGLKMLASGQIKKLAGMELPRMDQPKIDYQETFDLEEAALTSLYTRIQQGIISFAREIIEAEDLKGNIYPSQSIFDQVIRLSFDVKNYHDLGTVPTVFCGPHHLSCLLKVATRTLAGSALTRIPPPSGVDIHKWRSWTSDEAKRRPFLWGNHLGAVATGFLNSGQSLVTTCPTGAGKTTIATLKIASVLAAGRLAVYLAPTHALAAQAERDLKERLSVLALARDIANVSLDEPNIDNLPSIAVMTPEKCLALLSFSPSMFSRVGVLIFDECHILDPGIINQNGLRRQINVIAHGVGEKGCAAA
ncbi:DEAD/DEAH box helicase (plasmid) [Skermanella sp. TT6]|uniref:DEAD/DEAH box helicase n=1 Tax=Skermanella cutis TaxID=2775420 RepID=A0ABX7BJS6_9PROT|nr:DEAD/DEAH box helicase [Skermanella sp. TT6]QQP93499.1 DEAD/DEAH box helicase [Skermanella sp. TT6]